ncbi:dihydrofolate reductase [soil metagenome]
MLSLVVAMDENRLIGADNRLPWHMPADLRHFRAVTMGHPLLMGRRTQESIGRPLPGRKNIVVTHQQGYRAEGCTVVHRMADACPAADGQELMVIGGAAVFEQVLPAAQRIYLTRIHHAFEGDTYFPAIDWREWRELRRDERSADPRNPYPYSFIDLERRRAEGDRT